MALEIDPIPSPTRSDRVRLKRSERVSAILDEALDIVQEEGFEALTLQRLARRMGLVTTGIYRYFPSKDAITSALQRRAIVDVRLHFRDELVVARDTWQDAAPPTMALAQILYLAKLYLSLPKTKPRSWTYIAILLGDPRPLLPEAEVALTRQSLAEFLADVGKLFEEAVAREVLAPGPVDVRMSSYWAALHGAQCLEKARRLVPAMPGAVDVGFHASRALLTNWGASPARLTAAERLLTSVAPATATKKRSKG